MKRRIFSLLLALCMVMSLLPATVLANTETEGAASEVVVAIGGTTVWETTTGDATEDVYYAKVVSGALQDNTADVRANPETAWAVKLDNTKAVAELTFKNATLTKYMSITGEGTLKIIVEGDSSINQSAGAHALALGMKKGVEITSLNNARLSVTNRATGSYAAIETTFGKLTLNHANLYLQSNHAASTWRNATFRANQYNDKGKVSKYLDIDVIGGTLVIDCDNKGTEGIRCANLTISDKAIVTITSIGESGKMSQKEHDTAWGRADGQYLAEAVQTTGDFTINGATFVAINKSGNWERTLIKMPVGLQKVKAQFGTTYDAEELFDLDTTITGNITYPYVAFVYDCMGDHEYDGNTDPDCNVCGEIRDIPREFTAKFYSSDANSLVEQTVAPYETYYATVTDGKVSKFTKQDTEPESWQVKLDNTKSVAELVFNGATLTKKGTSKDASGNPLDLLTVTGAGDLKIITKAASTLTSHYGNVILTRMGGTTTYTSENGALLTLNQSGSSGYDAIKEEVGKLVFENANISANCTRQGNGAKAQVVYGSVSVSISGGSLNLEGYNPAVHGLYTPGALTITDDAQVTVAHTSDAYQNGKATRYGVYAGGKFTIDGASLTIIDKTGCFDYALNKMPETNNVTAKYSNYKEGYLLNVLDPEDKTLAIEYPYIEFKANCSHEWTNEADTECNWCGETREGLTAKSVTIRVVTDGQDSKNVKDITQTVAVGEIYYAVADSKGLVTELVAEEPADWDLMLDNTGAVAKLVFANNAYLAKSGDHAGFKPDEDNGEKAVSLDLICVSGEGALEVIAKSNTRLHSNYGDALETSMAGGVTYTTENGSLLKMEQNGTSGACAIHNKKGTLTFVDANILATQGRTNETWPNAVIEAAANVKVINSRLDLRVKNGNGVAVGARGIYVAGKLTLSDYAWVSIQQNAIGADTYDGVTGRPQNPNYRFGVFASAIIIDKSSLYIVDNKEDMFEYMLNKMPAMRDAEAFYSLNLDGSDRQILTSEDTTGFGGQAWAASAAIEFPYVAIVANCPGHTGGTATCKDQAICEICNNPYGDLVGCTPAEDDGNCTTAIKCTVCGKVITEAKSHDFDTDPATDDKCKNENCNVTAGIQHVHDYAEVMQDETGHWTKCSCGAETEKVAHNTEGSVDHKDATCTEEGVVGGTYCTACGFGKAAAEEKISVVPHNTDGKVEHKDATCTEEGVVGGTYCTVCGNGKAAAEEKIPVVPHNTDGKVEHKDATCTEEGVVGGTYCTVCENGKAAAEEKIPVVPHNTDGKVEHKDATCTEEGVVGGTYCTVCENGKAAAEEKIPVVPHNTDGKVDHKDATCTEEGVVGGTYCTVCENGKAAAEEKIPVAPHNTDGKVEHKDATCTEEGVVGGTYCTVCENGKAAAEEKIPVVPHNTDGKVEHKDATCTEEGVVGGTYCTVCGNGKAAAEEKIPATGHNANGNVAHKDATCTEEGVVGGTYCTVCENGKAAAEEKIPVIGHSYIYTSKNDRTHTVTCANCTVVNSVEDCVDTDANNICDKCKAVLAIYVAENNKGEKFESLQAALNADGKLVTLLTDVVLTEKLVITWSEGGLNLNGFSITGNVVDPFGMIYIKKDATINFIGEGTIENKGGVAIGNYGYVRIEEEVTVIGEESGYAGLYNFYYAPDYYGQASVVGNVNIIWNCGKLNIGEGAEIGYLDNSGYAEVFGEVDEIYAQDGSDCPGVPNAGILSIRDITNVTVPDDYKLVRAGEIGYKVVAKTYVAQVGDEKFETLAEAIAEGGNVTLLADIKLDAAIKVSNTVVLNLNGKNISMTDKDTAGDGVFYVVAGGNLTINGEGVVNGVGNNKYNMVIWADGGKVTINGGIYTNIGAQPEGDNHFDLIYVKNGGEVIINGGEFKCETPFYTLNVNNDLPGTITVNGGKFWNFDPANGDDKLEGSFIAADKHTAVDNNGYFAICGGKIVNHDAKAPTCTEIGWDAYDTCENCDYTTYVAKDATGHNANGKVDHKDATCTEDGVVGGTYCTACNDGKAEAEAVITAPGHNTDGVVDHKDATCTEDGVVGGNYCTVCENGKAAAEEVIAAKGHRFSKVDVTSATCTEAGYITLGCGNCGGEWDSRYDDVAKQYLLDNPYFNLAAKGHNTDGVVDHKDATCTEDGVVGGNYCTVCENGKAAAEEVIAAKGHRFSKVDVTSATCTEAGYITLGCGNCGGEWDSRYDDVAKQYLLDNPYFNLAAKGHNTDGVVDHKDATCTEEGVVGGTYCTACDFGKAAAEEKIPATGHKFTEFVKTVKPTDTTRGYTVYKCANCDETEVRDIVAAYTDAVAIFEEEYYNTLAEALAAAKLSTSEEKVITMIRKQTGAALVIDTNVTIDFKGLAYTVNTANEDGSAVIIAKDAIVTLENGTIQVRTAQKTLFNKLIVNNGNLTTKDITLRGDNLGAAGERTTIVNKGTLKLDVGTVVTTNMFALEATGNVTKDVTVELEAPEGYDWIDGTTLKGHEHSYTETVVEANFDRSGYTKHVCDCGESYIDSVVANLVAYAVNETTGVRYETFAKAVAEAKDGETVKLLKKQTGAALVINANITINLDGKTYTVNATETGAAIDVADGVTGAKIINGEAETKGMVQIRKTSRANFNCLVNNLGALEANDITLNATYADAEGAVAFKGNAITGNATIVK